MLKKILKDPLFWILTIAILLRIYQLDQRPAGFHVDEVKAGWNAYSIAKIGMDDWGDKFPIHYNSFGDFRPAGFFYLIIPSIILFGLNEFAVRFPAAFLGALTVLPIFLLTLNFSGKRRRIALYAGFFLAISVWSITLSRATSEAIASVFLTLTGLYFFVNFLKAQDRKNLALAFVFLFSSYFFYHSARLLTPIFMATIFIYFWKTEKAKLTKPTFFLLAFFFLSTLFFGLNKEARGRFSQVSIFADLDVRYELAKMPFDEGPNNVFIARLFHNKPVVYTRRFLNEYAQYFSANFFLIPKVAKPARYQTVGVGALTYAELGLFILGLLELARGKNRLSALPFFLLLLAPIPAALTTEDAPNISRSVFMFPFIAVIEAYGFYSLATIARYGNLLKKAALSFVLLNLIFFLHMYFVHNPIHFSNSRDAGAKELALKLGELQPKYDEIIITDIPDSPYPWFAFFTKQNPKIFNEQAAKRKDGIWSFENITFASSRCPSRDAFVKKTTKKILVVDAETCETEAYKYNYGDDVKILDQIKRPDQTIVYTLWSRTQ